MNWFTKNLSVIEMRIEVAGLKTRIEYLQKAIAENIDSSGKYELVDDIQRLAELEAEMNLRGVRL